MTTPAQPQESYVFSASIIAQRLTILRGLPAPSSYLEAETMALHVRKIVEGVAFAALSAIEHSAAHLESWRTKDADKLLGLLESKRLLLLPTAQDVQPGVATGASARNLSAKDLKAAFGLASGIVHERHPERLTNDVVAKMCAEIASTAARLDGWLWNHVTHFVRDSRQSAFLVRMGLLGVPGFFAPLTKVGDGGEAAPRAPSVHALLDPFPMYVSLWKMAQEKGIVVEYGDMPNGGAGGFREDRLGWPVISLVRAHTGLDQNEPTRTHDPDAPPDEQPDILEELITLAHEYGHWCSWREGNRTPGFRGAVDRFNYDDPGPLTEADRDLIRAEEDHADRLGAAVLRELGFDAWDAWDRRVARARDLYAERFDDRASR